jgi:LuxR family transcriptional regulator, maltose regulon positive regulatory protein
VDEDLRAFLVQTSIAERFTAELCRELTGRTDADALLERAERANLFIVPLDAERRWYRYHRLFADYLSSQLGDHERRALHELAADYFDRAGLAAEAIDHALAAGSVDRAVRLAEREAQPTFEAGELATLLGWLDALPPERVAANAQLLSLQGWALFLTGQIAAAQACAERQPIAAGADGPAEGRLYALRALLAPIISGAPDAANLARAGLELLGEDEPVRVLTLLALGTAKLAASEPARAVETLRPALAAARRTRQPMAVLTAAAMLALGLNATGARAEAELLSRSMLDEVKDARGRPLAGSWYLGQWVLGILRYEAGDLVEAVASSSGALMPLPDPAPLASRSAGWCCIWRWYDKPPARRSQPSRPSAWSRERRARLA